jgi:F420-non-reducing hydrogenase large subunit
VIELLSDHEITDPNVRGDVTPGAGRGIGCVEAPRGTLIHDYTTDDNGLIARANIIVGTTHNVAPMNMSIRQVAQEVVQKGVVTEEGLNKVEMAVRAYDP